MDNRGHRMGDRIAFLVGAGVSQAAGLPGVNDITDRIISGQGIIHCSDNTYDFVERYGGRGFWCDDYPPRMAEYAKILKGEIEKARNVTDSHPVNYEELCYHALEMANFGFRGAYNAGLRPFMQILEKAAGPIMKGKTSTWDLSFGELNAEVFNYIDTPG